MKISDLRVFRKFLARNKLYTFVTVFGFSVSLMFVIILGAYVKEQLTVDDFREKKDRIFLMTHDKLVMFGNPVAPFVKERFPEVENYVRMYANSVDVGKKGFGKITADALFADSTFFQVFTVPLIEGDPSQALQSRQSVVVSESFANKYYADKRPVGAELVINNREYIVTGLMKDMPHNSMLPEADFIVNYYGITDFFGDQVISTSDNFGFVTFLLEKKGADLRSKTSDMLDLFKEEFWFYKNGFSSDLKLIPLKEAYFDIEHSSWLKVNSLTSVTVYAGIALLILVIALLNYINLTVAQVGFRGKEAAVKKLAGADRRTLVLQLLTESFLMITFTFVLGLFAALLVEPFFNDVLNTKLELSDQLTVPVILSFVGFIFFIAIVAGLLPALFISSFNPIEVVKGTFNRKVKTGYSKVLIVFQYTVVITLLICSFFIKKQFDYLINYDIGFNHEGILVMPNVLKTEELDGLKSKLSGIPGVELISFSKGTPLDGGNNMSYETDGQQFSFQEIKVDSTFFKIFGITVVENTGVTATHETFWVNRKAYTALNPDPITHMADFGWGQKKQIAGILNDFNIWSLHQETGLIRMGYYNSDYDWDRPWNVVVKLSPGTDYRKTAEIIEKEYSAYSGGEIIEATFMDDMIRRSYQKEQKTSALMNAFTLLTIVIMIMGVFAMSLYIIRQKQKEISIRKVNGATEMQILTMLNIDSLKRVLIAFAVACPIAYYASSKWLEAFPYKISLDWKEFAVAGLIVLLLTLLSVSQIAWRAARMNPVKFLNTD